MAMRSYALLARRVLIAPGASCHALSVVQSRSRDIDILPTLTRYSFWVAALLGSLDSVAGGLGMECGDKEEEVRISSAQRSEAAGSQRREVWLYIVEIVDDSFVMLDPRQRSCCGPDLGGA